MLNHVMETAHVSAGWLALAAVGIAVLAYFLGCFNGAVVVSRYILRDDVRNHGSGNAGLTNFYRTFGGPLTLVVILSDAVKAVLAVVFAMWIAGTMSPELITLSKYWAGLFCLLGHMFPITFQFRGGKGILSGGTIALMMDWRVALVVWGGFLILAILTRYVSLGSCWAGLSFPFVTGFVYQDVLLTVIAIIIGGLILFKHRGNMVRLVQGTESKFALHKKKNPEVEEDTVPPAEAPEASTQEVSSEEVDAEPQQEADAEAEETSTQEDEVVDETAEPVEEADAPAEKKEQEAQA